MENFIYGLLLGLAIALFAWLRGNHEKYMKSMYWEWLKEYEKEAKFWKEISEDWKKLANNRLKQLQEIMKGRY